LETVALSPRITVVTPSYNQGKFLEETLRSVASQREYIHEYFVLDGGSTDGSADIIRKYADKIDWWTSEKDKGQSDAIHRGFQRATGDYLYWLNSDDVLLPGAMAKVTAALQEHPQWDALTGYHVRMDVNSRVICMNRIPPESPSNSRWGRIHVCQQTCFFRRSIYEKLGGLNLSLHIVMDTEMWCRMFDANTVWGHIPQYLAGFRMHLEAKGRAQQWHELCESEQQMVREVYPQYCQPNFKHRLGLAWYRALQILSGRYLKAKLDTRRFFGKTLDEVGDGFNG
jgi:glycosyltransferase involved in cell wall biosynthesis